MFDDQDLVGEVVDIYAKKGEKIMVEKTSLIGLIQEEVSTDISIVSYIPLKED